MKKIDVGQGFEALVDDEDFERVSKVKWWLVRDKNGLYAKRNIKVGDKWTTQTLHSFVLRLPRSTRIDHRDHNGLNNQKQNLRPATQSQNCQNRRRTGNKFGHKGIFFDPRCSKPYGVRLRTKWRNFSCGFFDTIKEAASAYNKKAVEIFGEFACLNKI